MTTRADLPPQGAGALSSGPHLFGLDGLRIAAAVAVAAFHLTWLYPPLAGLPPVGWVGVETFFVLSGVVISNSIERTEPARFLVNRALRLYPAAWICAAIGLAAIVASGGAHAIVGIHATAAPAAVASSLTLVGDAFVGSAYWTLQVEVAFYLAVFTSVALLGGGGLETLAKALVVWGAPYVLSRVLAPLAGWNADWLDLGYGALNMTLARHGALFGLGMLIWLSRSDETSRRFRGWIAAAALLGALEIAIRAGEIAMQGVGDHAAASIAIAGVGVWAASCLFIHASLRPGAFAPSCARVRRAVRLLGLMSYPFYLLHEALGGSVMGALVRHGAPDGVALAAALAAAAFASYVVAAIAEPALRRLLAPIGRLATPAPASS